MVHAQTGVKVLGIAFVLALAAGAVPRTTTPQYVVVTSTSVPASLACWWGEQQRPSSLRALTVARDSSAAVRPYPSHLRVAYNGILKPYYSPSKPRWPYRMLASALALTLVPVPLNATPHLVFSSLFGKNRNEVVAAVRANPQAAHVFYTHENVDAPTNNLSRPLKGMLKWQQYTDHLLDYVDVALGFHPLSMHPRNASHRGEYARLPFWLKAATDDTSGMLKSELTAPVSTARDADEWSRRPCFASFIASHTSYPRAELVQALSELGRGFVLAPGKALHNSTWEPVAENDKHAFMSRCRFAVTPENSEGAGYVTEKLVHAHLAGVVPVYWGGDGLAADARVFNPARVLKFSEAEGMGALQARVLALDTDPLARAAFFAQPLLMPGAEAVVLDLITDAVLAIERALIAAALRSGWHELSACTYPPALEALA